VQSIAKPARPPSAPSVMSFVDKTTRKDDIRRSLNDLCAAIAARVGDTSFDAFLAYAARFHRYSWRNTLLIVFQRPEATFVAGFRRWQELGRKVKRGAKAVWILAPRRYTKTVERGEGEEKEVEGLYFCPVPVFADVDTEGEGPLPNFRPNIAEASDLLPALHGVTASFGVPLLRTPCEGNGWSDGRQVNVDPSLPDGIAAQTLLHELAHHSLKHRELAEKEEGDRSLFEGEDLPAGGGAVLVLVSGARPWPIGRDAGGPGGLPEEVAEGSDSPGGPCSPCADTTSPVPASRAVLTRSGTRRRPWPSKTVLTSVRCRPCSGITTPRSRPGMPTPSTVSRRTPLYGFTWTADRMTRTV